MSQAPEPSPADQYLQLAVELATRNVGEGGGPFGAVVVTADGGMHQGVNRVTRDNDPTAHAEVVAYTSCEPCPLCLASALWARIGRVYYAADRHGAAAAGFDDAVFYEYFAGDRPELMPVTRSDIPTSDAPFQAWGAHTGRTAY